MPTYKVTRTKIIPKENPNNPRTITKEEFARLVASIKKSPEFLEVRRIIVNKEGEIIGGNQRWKAALEAGMKKEDIPIYEVDWSKEKQSEFTIKDNLHSGQWDWDILANEYETTELQDWGLNVWTGDSLFNFEAEVNEVIDEAVEPTHTAEGYTMFEIVMLIENKRKFIETITSIKEKFKTDKTEEALMILINTYNNANK
tara:strand:- start:867 stop:1466 length:600 start_codon:yes stop_codon:yes gene_type:complete